MARVLGGPVRHDATLAYRLRNVEYADGHLYANGLRHSQVERREPYAVSMGDAETIEACSLPGSVIGDKYFGHFLSDTTSTTLLAQEFAPALLPEGTSRAAWSHAGPYYEFLDLHPGTIRKAHIKDAWVFQDYAMTASRRERLTRLRDRLRALGGPRSGHGVFIRRKTSGALRLLLNEDEIEARLRAENFEIVDPVADPAEEIISRICNASIVVSVEGSALAHGLLAMAPQGSMLTLQPPYRFDNIWKDYTDLLGMRYGYVVGEGSPDTFRVDLDDIMRTIDLLEKAKPLAICA